MPFDPKRLRKVFAAGAVFIVLVVAGIYIVGILKSRSNIPPAPKPLQSNVQSSASGFSFSKSEGGKTLFTIRAASVEQYKEGGKARLHDVSIVIYGRNQDRSDQIYGSDFAYDPVARIVTAEGEVRIDLEAESAGGGKPGQSPAQETRNLIHVKTSGLSVNENTGIAETPARIEFRLPEANGSAVGATYDSHGGMLTLKSAVKIDTTGKRKATITGQSAVMTKAPSKMVLQSARVEEPPRTFSADRVTVFMRDDNNVDRVEASANLHAVKTGPKGFDMTAPQGELRMTDDNLARSGLLSGGVTFATKSDSPADGKAGKILFSFAGDNQLTKARAEDSVQLKQGPAGRSQEIHAAAIDLSVTNGKKLEKAVTSSGPAEIVLEKGEEKTTISAGRFETTFNEQNRPATLYGTPDAKIVDSEPNKPDRVLTSRELRGKFNDKGELASAELIGDFHYQEQTQTATAERADYRAGDETVVLTGSPRVVDTTGTLTADTIQLNRKTSNAIAEKNVKTTYIGLKAQPNGAMLGGADPVHVTGTSVTANRSTTVPPYTQP